MCSNTFMQHKNITLRHTYTLLNSCMCILYETSFITSYLAEQPPQKLALFASYPLPISHSLVLYTCVLLFYRRFGCFAEYCVRKRKKKNVTALYVWFSGVSQMVVGGCCACRILYYTWYIRYDGVDSLIPQVTNTMVFAGKIYFSQKQLLFGGKKMK